MVKSCEFIFLKAKKILISMLTYYFLLVSLTNALKKRALIRYLAYLRKLIIWCHTIYAILVGKYNILIFKI